MSIRTLVLAVLCAVVIGPAVPAPGSAQSILEDLRAKCLNRNASAEQVIATCIAFNGTPGTLPSDKSDAYASLAVVRFNQGRPWLAVAEANLSLLHDPKNHLARYIRGRGMLAAERYEAALEDFDNVARKAEGRLVLWAIAGRAVVLWTLGRDGEALADFQTALASGPGNASYRSVLFEDRAMVWIAKGDYAAALEDLNEALALNPQSVLARDLRGLVHARFGAFRRALADYDRAIEIAGDGGSGARYRLAWLLATGPDDLLDAPRAKELAWSALIRDIEAGRPPQALAQTRHVLAAALVANGETGEALDTYADVMQADPRFVGWYRQDLLARGYDPGPDDGRFGPAMRQAVAACLAAGCRMRAERWCGYDVPVPCRDAFR